jgi:hypothetical protein
MQHKQLQAPPQAEEEDVEEVAVEEGVGVVEDVAGEVVGVARDAVGVAKGSL